MRKNGKSSEHSGAETNYSNDAMSLKETIPIVGKAAMIVGLMALLFYDSPIAVPFLVPIGAALILRDLDRARERRQDGLRKQFQECLLSVSAALSAGYSPENAFRSAARELAMLYGPQEDIMRELQMIQARLDMNENLESILADFAQRSGLEEVRSFSDVFLFAKRSGGNLNRILSNTAGQIGDRIETEEQIRTVMAEKRMEQQILNVIPIGILAYLKVASPGYLDVLYRNMAGIVIMTACLGVYIAAYLLSERIAAIEI